MRVPDSMAADEPPCTVMQAGYAITMAAYNHWMNSRLYTACATLADEARKRDASAYFKSIHGTLNHLLLADRVWMGRFTGKPCDFPSLDHELYAEFSMLAAERQKTDREIEAWAASLTQAQLQGQLRYISMVGGEPRHCPLWLAAMHFFNHQTHHRGQLTTLLSQQGIDPGVTDLISMPGLAHEHFPCCPSSEPPNPP